MRLDFLGRGSRRRIPRDRPGGAAGGDGGSHAGGGGRRLRASALSARVGQVSLVAGKVGEIVVQGDAQWSAAARSTTRPAGPWCRAAHRCASPRRDLASAPIRRDSTAEPRSAVGQARPADRRGRLGRAGSISTSAISTPARASRSTSRAAGSGCCSWAATTSMPAAAVGRARIAAYTRQCPGLLAAAPTSPVNAGEPARAERRGASLPRRIEAASGDEFAEWCGARAVDDSRLAAPYFLCRAR